MVGRESLLGKDSTQASRSNGSSYKKGTQRLEIIRDKHPGWKATASSATLEDTGGAHWSNIGRLGRVAKSTKLRLDIRLLFAL